MIQPADIRHTHSPHRRPQAPSGGQTNHGETRFGQLRCGLPGALPPTPPYPYWAGRPTGGGAVEPMRRTNGKKKKQLIFLHGTGVFFNWLSIYAGGIARHWAGVTHLNDFNGGRADGPR